MPAVVNIDPVRFQEIRQQGNAVILDVRTDQEVGRGKIPGALHIPLQALPGRKEELPRDRPVLVYCLSGARSLHAGNFLLAEGWPEVYNLAGGVTAWLGRGFELTGQMP